MEKVFEIYIKTTPGRLSKDITDREVRRKDDFGAVVTPDGTTGSQYEGAGEKTAILGGENLEVDAPRPGSLMWMDDGERHSPGADCCGE